MLSHVKVVMLHGGDAHSQWRKLAKRHRREVLDVEVIETYHTSNQAFIGTEAARQQRLEHLRASFARAAAIIDVL